MGKIEFFVFASRESVVLFLIVVLLRPETISTRISDLRLLRRVEMKIKGLKLGSNYMFLDHLLRER